MSRFDKWAQNAYLGFYVADKYPEQKPAYVAARWYDLLWLLIPICGLIAFVGFIEERYEEQRNARIG